MSTITRSPVTHNLKIWPEYYAAVCAGDKRAELRWNDRDYQAGDTLDLCEWDPNEEAFTGEFISVTVTHVAELGQWMPGYMLLSIALASLEAEHVAYVSQSNLDALKRGHNDVFVKRTDDVARPVPLFTAPPVPVSVPDEATPENIEILASTFAPRGVTYQWDRDECNAAADSWNACRAAMLHGADGNSPVIPDGLRLALSNAGIAAPESDEMLAATSEKHIQALVTWVKDRKPFQQAVPAHACTNDGWVACSERMPEVVLHMGQAMSVFEALKKEILSEHVRHAELGAMGAVNVQVWTSVLGGTLQYETSNGGCTLRVIAAAPQKEV